MCKFICTTDESIFESENFKSQINCNAQWNGFALVPREKIATHHEDSDRKVNEHKPTAHVKIATFMRAFNVFFIEITTTHVLNLS